MNVKRLVFAAVCITLFSCGDDEPVIVAGARTDQIVFRASGGASWLGRPVSLSGGAVAITPVTVDWDTICPAQASVIKAGLNDNFGISAIRNAMRSPAEAAVLAQVWSNWVYLKDSCSARAPVDFADVAKKIFTVDGTQNQWKLQALFNMMCNGPVNTDVESQASIGIFGENVDLNASGTILPSLIGGVGAAFSQSKASFVASASPVTFTLRQDVVDCLTKGYTGGTSAASHLVTAIELGVQFDVAVGKINGSVTSGGSGTQGTLKFTLESGGFKASANFLGEPPAMLPSVDDVIDATKKGTPDQILKSIASKMLNEPKSLAVVKGTLAALPSCDPARARLRSFTQDLASAFLAHYASLFLDIGTDFLNTACGGSPCQPQNLLQMYATPPAEMNSSLLASMCSEINVALNAAGEAAIPSSTCNDPAAIQNTTFWAKYKNVVAFQSLADSSDAAAHMAIMDSIWRELLGQRQAIPAPLAVAALRRIAPANIDSLLSQAAVVAGSDKACLSNNTTVDFRNASSVVSSVLGRVLDYYSDANRVSAVGFQSGERAMQCISYVNQRWTRAGTPCPTAVMSYPPPHNVEQAARQFSLLY